MATRSMLSEKRLYGSKHRFPHRQREVDKRKILCRVKIVFTRLINYTNLAMLCGVGIR